MSMEMEKYNKAHNVAMAYCVAEREYKALTLLCARPLIVFRTST